MAVTVIARDSEGNFKEVELDEFSAEEIINTNNFDPAFETYEVLHFETTKMTTIVIRICSYIHGGVGNDRSWTGPTSSYIE